MICPVRANSGSWGISGAHPGVSYVGWILRRICRILLLPAGDIAHSSRSNRATNRSVSTVHFESARVIVSLGCFTLPTYLFVVHVRSISPVHKLPQRSTSLGDFLAAVSHLKFIAAQSAAGKNATARGTKTGTQTIGGKKNPTTS